MNVFSLQFQFLEFLRKVFRKCKKLTSLTLYDYVHISDEDMCPQNDDIFPTLTHVCIQVFHPIFCEGFEEMSLADQLQKKDKFIVDFKKYLAAKFPNLKHSIQVDDQTDNDTYIEFANRLPKC